MTREDSIKIVEELVQSPNIKKHCLAAEVVMLSLYDQLSRQKKSPELTREAWGIVGLLHDADYEVTEKKLEKHTEVVSERLTKLGTEKEIIDAIRGHADKEKRTTLLAKAIYACDDLTGLIVAAALVRPDKKLSGLTVESTMKRFREPAFARGANRELIETCESELDMPLKDFIEISLKAMQGIARELGL